MDGPTRQTRAGRTAFVFLYAVCALALVAVLVTSSSAVVRDPIELSTRAIYEDHALYAALSGINYGRHYVAAMVRDINENQPGVIPPWGPNTVSLYFVEDWAGGPDNTQCLTARALWTPFNFGSICQHQTTNNLATGTEFVRLSFTLRLNENIIRNYWIYSWMPAPPSNLMECVPTSYEDVDPPAGILYRIESVGTAQIPNQGLRTDWRTVATRTMTMSFTIVNDNMDLDPPRLELRMVTRNIELNN